MDVTMLGCVLGLYTLRICYGLSIDVMEIKSSSSRNPPAKIICQFTQDEIQNAQNKISMTHEGLDLAECKGDTLMCTTASDKYKANITKGQSALTIRDMDLFYEGNTWACVLGSKTASLKLKYFRAAKESLLEQLVSKINIVDLLTFLVVLVILGIMLILVVRFCCCRKKRKRSRDSTSKDEPESRLCCPCFFKKEEPKKKGYDGTKYEVKTDYTIKDPNHKATHKFKDGIDRKKEAEMACAKISPETKEAATNIFTKYAEGHVEARKLLNSTSDQPNA